MKSSGKCFPMVSIQARYLKALRNFVRRNGIEALRGLDRKKFEGLKIGRWTYDLHMRHRRGQLSREMTKAVESIPGWTWRRSLKDPELRLRRLKEFVSRHGFGALRQTTVYRGIHIGSWANAMRSRYHHGRLSNEIIRALERIKGWSWTPKEAHHELMAKTLRDFIKLHGWKKFRIDLTYRGMNIGRWVERRRYDYKYGAISKPLVQLARSIPGWRWQA